MDNAVVEPNIGGSGRRAGRAASAYEAATKHRGPPQAFGPLRGEP